MASMNTADDTGSVPFPKSPGAADPAGTAEAPPATEGSKPADVMNQVVQMAHSTIDKLAERAAPAVQRIQEGVSGTNQMLHDSADKLRNAGDEWTDNLRVTVRDNPLTALAAAAAAGVVLAWLMRSSD